MSVIWALDCTDANESTAKVCGNKCQSSINEGLKGSRIHFATFFYKAPKCGNLRS